MAKTPASKPPAALRRTAAGRYETGDGRFTVEASSGRWMVIDTEVTDDLGLPLVRGPFATLDAARAAMEGARSGPAPTSDLAGKIAALPKGARASVARSAARTRTPRTSPEPPEPPARPEPTVTVGGRATRPPTIELRDYRTGDGDALRALWATVGFRSLGDDDPSLERLAARNPGLLLVATAGDQVIGSALGGWDGRRGWIYHVASAPEHRRAGVATRLVRRLEGRLRTLGCPKVNVIVRDENKDGRRFWEALGYGAAPARQLGKEL